MFKDKTLFGKKDEEHTTSNNPDSIAATTTATTSPATSFTTFSTNTNGHTATGLNIATATTDLSEQHTEELTKNLPEKSNQSLFSSSSSELSDLSDSEAETERMTFSQRQQTGYPLDPEGEFKSQLLQMASSDNNIPTFEDLQPAASNTSSPLSNLSSERPNDREGTIIVDHNSQNEDNEFKHTNNITNNSTTNISVDVNSNQSSNSSGNKAQTKSEKDTDPVSNDPIEQTTNSSIANSSPSKIKIDGEALVPKEAINSSTELSVSTRSAEDLSDNSGKFSNEIVGAINDNSNESIQKSTNAVPSINEQSEDNVSDHKNTDLPQVENGTSNQKISEDTINNDLSEEKDSDKQKEEDIEMQDHLQNDVSKDNTIKLMLTKEAHSTESCQEQDISKIVIQNNISVYADSKKSSEILPEDQNLDSLADNVIVDTLSTEKATKTSESPEETLKRKAVESSDMIDGLPNGKRQRTEVESYTINGTNVKKLEDNLKTQNATLNNKNEIEIGVPKDLNKDIETLDNEVEADSNNEYKIEQPPAKSDNTSPDSESIKTDAIIKSNVAGNENKLDETKTLDVEIGEKVSKSELPIENKKDTNDINTLEKVNNNDLREEFQNEVEIGGDEDEDAEEDEDEEDEDLPKNRESFEKKVEGDDSEKAVEEIDQVDDAEKQYELEQKQIKQTKEAIDKLTEIEIDFAKLKDKLYEDKLKTFEQEIQMCINGIHPTLKSLYSKIEEYRTEKLQQINNRKNYQLLNIDRCTRAKRASIHQQHIMEKNEIKLGILNDLTLKWYDINRDRKVMNSLTPEYSYRIPISDSDQSVQPLVDQLADVNDEIQILKTISQKFGFPVASRLTSGTNEEILEDFTALGLL